MNQTYNIKCTNITLYDYILYYFLFKYLYKLYLNNNSCIYPYL